MVDVGGTPDNKTRMLIGGALGSIVTEAGIVLELLRNLRGKTKADLAFCEKL